MNGNGKSVGMPPDPNRVLQMPAQPEMTPEMIERMERIKNRSELVFENLEGLTMNEGLSVIKTVEQMLQARMREIYSQVVIDSAPEKTEGQ